VRQKKGCETLCYELKGEGFQANAIHGDKTQRDRDQVLRDFRSNRISIMVATDVAARGLDIKDLNHVINYDFPGQIEDYVHRIGRTARAGAKGTSISFFTRKNGRIAGDLVKLLKESKQEIPNQLLGMVRVTAPAQHNRYQQQYPRRDFGWNQRNTYQTARSRSPRQSFY
jgi:ATP-dependent RNA helicase DDX5/DBP2